MLPILVLSLVALVPAPPASPTLARVESAQETVDALITRGRALLAEGKPADAQKTFEEAARKDGDSLRTRVWVLRAWLAQGRLNDAQDETDKLDRAGQKGPEIDYLYGVAWSLRSKEYLAQNVGGAIVDAAFNDATAFLEKATKADPTRFADAFPMLADAAWHSQKLELARRAGEKAVELLPNDVDARVLLGRICMSQFVVANADDAQKAEADGHWEAARGSFEKAAAMLKDAKASADRSKLADVLVELGHAYGWKARSEDQAKAYTAALKHDPSAVDLAQVRGALKPEQFLAALEEGEKGFTASHEPTDTGDAAILWWLGLARFEGKEYAKAEDAFVAAVTKWPQYYNSWFYVALARYHQQKYDEAIAALRKHFDANPEDLVASIESNREMNIGIIGYLTGRCADAKPPKNLDAAFLCELLTNVDPKSARNWNDLGLFLRDEGESLQRARKAEDKPKIRDLMERAYVAYRRALDLEPDDPNYLNDTALMLHYHLDRDLDQARAWYVKAAERAEAELARKDLPPDVRELRQTALRDSKNNLRDLDAILEARKKGGEKTDPAKKDGG